MLDELKTDTSLSRQADWLKGYRLGLRISEQGRVRSVGDGVSWIQGLPSAAMDEILELEDGSRALVFHLGKTLIGTILLYQTKQLTAGTRARLTGRYLVSPVGEELFGRVIDPFGVPLDGLPPLQYRKYRPLDPLSPPITARAFVERPLYTGNKIVDTMIPIGRGQRQLIIGDSGVGKSSLAMDTVIHQRGQNVLCVYVLIGQKRSTTVGVIETLREAGALAYTTVVVAEATALPGLKYLAPFAGCTIAEDWMHQGKDTLVVYDDLTTHARTYRELSLLLQRPPGREAYPGDIFYLHSRLLERATCLAPSAGSGSMVALPLVETKQGEIAAYIPTNLISITDGQVYLDKGLFSAGILPAIDVTRSVSRIGGKAQHPRIKAEAARMKLDYLQFLELEVFARFGTRLEASMEANIRRGRILREILKQERYSPLPIEFQAAWLVAFNEGYLDGVSPDRIPNRLAQITDGLRQSGLTLEDSHDRWINAVKVWLAQEEGHEPAP